MTTISRRPVRSAQRPAQQAVQDVSTNNVIAAVAGVLGGLLFASREPFTKLIGGGLIILSFFVMRTGGRGNDL